MLFYGVAMCAPLVALQNFKYKVKLVPGSKQGGAIARACLRPRWLCFPLTLLGGCALCSRRDEEGKSYSTGDRYDAEGVRSCWRPTQSHRRPAVSHRTVFCCALLHPVAQASGATEGEKDAIKSLPEPELTRTIISNCKVVSC